MMKRFSILSLVVGVAIIFSMTVFGCKKAEQQAEVPKSAGQGSAEGFVVSGGTLEKGGLGYGLSSDKDKMATAIKHVGPFKNTLRVQCKISSPAVGSHRNGFIVFGNSADQAMAGVFVGARLYTIDGSLVKSVKESQEFDQNKVFDLEVTADLQKKTVVLKVDGHEVKTAMTKVPASIKYVGYAVSGGKAEFSDLMISGD